jgi:hypothetical protein
MVGWANAAVEQGKLRVALGFVTRRPRDPGFGRALDEEVARLEAFLGDRRAVTGAPAAAQKPGGGATEGG